MAKVSMKNREAKRSRLVAKYATKRVGLPRLLCKNCRAMLARFVSVTAAASLVVRTVYTASLV